MTTATTLANVQAVPLSLISTRDQVRTRNGFDDESITQLAESIKTYGVLQPIVVTRDPESDGCFLVVYGHRRFAASQKAKLETIPAIVTETAPIALTEVQLTENLQRENLNLADTADAVRKLYDTHKKVAIVAKRVNKSVAWVSKHLALTSPTFDESVRALVEYGTVQDVEILNSLNQIAKHKSERAPATLQRLLTKAIDETLSRADVRDSLAKLNAPTEAATEETNDTGADDGGEDEGDDGESDSEQRTKAESHTITLTHAEWVEYVRLGGIEWLREQLAD